MLQKVRKELPVALKGGGAEETATAPGQSRVRQHGGRHEQRALLNEKEWLQQQ